MSIVNNFPAFFFFLPVPSKNFLTFKIQHNLLKNENFSQLRFEKKDFEWKSFNRLSWFFRGRYLVWEIKGQIDKYWMLLLLPYLSNFYLFYGSGIDIQQRTKIRLRIYRLKANKIIKQIVSCEWYKVHRKFWSLNCNVHKDDVLVKVRVDIAVVLVLFKRSHSG
jgi:hypothetical protein